MALSLTMKLKADEGQKRKAWSRLMGKPSRLETPGTHSSSRPEGRRSAYQASALHTDCLGSNPASAVATGCGPGSAFNLPREMRMAAALFQWRRYAQQGAQNMGAPIRVKAAPSRGWPLEQQVASALPARLTRGLRPAPFPERSALARPGPHQCVVAQCRSLIPMQTVSRLWAKFACPLLPDFHK